MSRAGRLVGTVAVVIACYFTISVFTTSPVQATNPQAVIVSNTPLPVQGTVSVGNTASVTVANTPSVTVSNTPTVSVANSVLPVNGNVSVSNGVDSGNNPIPLTVTEQGKPFQAQCNTFNNETSCPISVPSGMRLVIQEFDYSDSGIDLPDVLLGLALQTQVNGTNMFHQFSPSFIDWALTSNVTIRLYRLHQPTTLYADAGSTVTCSVTGTSFAPQVATCTVSGYLIPS